MTAPGPGAAPTLRELALVGLLFALLWGVLAAEAVLAVGSRVPGAINTETWAFLWGHHAMSEALWEQGRWFYRTALLDHPHGGVLWLKDPLWTALLSPVTRLFGAPVSLVLEGGLLLGIAGVALYGLARQLGLARGASLAGALVFAACPHFLGEAYNGNPEAMAHGWMALWLWALAWTLQAPSWRRALVLALALFLLFLGNQYYFLSMALASPVFGLWQLWRHRAGGRHGARIGWSAAGVVGGVLLCLPVVAVISASIDDPAHLTLLDDSPQPYPPFTTDPRQLIEPLAVLPHAPPNVFQDLVYPGWLLVLATLAAALWRRDLAAAFALALGATFLVLSMGPVLLEGGTAVLDETGAPTALPFYHLQHWHPAFARMTLPHRLAMPAALGWGLGLALCVDQLQRLGRAGTGGALLLTVAAAAELVLVPGYTLPLETSPAERPAWARAVAETDRGGGLLALPSAGKNNSRAVYLWHQATHGLPVGMSLRVGRHPSVLGADERGSRDERARFDALLRDDPAGLPDDLAARLAAADFRWVVLHLWLVDRPETHAAWVAALEAQLGPGVPFAGGVVVYPVNADDEDVLRSTTACAESCVDAVELGAPPPEDWRPKELPGGGRRGFD